MDSTNVDWEGVKSKIAEFEVTVFPFDDCTWGNQLGLVPQWLFTKVSIKTKALNT